MKIKKGNVKKITFFLLLLIAWMIFGLNTDNADFAAYLNNYKMIRLSGWSDRFEIGYTMIELLAVKMGLDFQQFLMMYSAIGLLLIGRSLYDYCKYPCLAFLLYFIYPFFFDVVQIRNFMAMAIVFWGIRFLKEFNKRNVILYIAIVIFSMTFHITSVFAFIYLLVYIKDYNKLLKIVYALIIAWIILYFITPGVFINLLLNFVESTDIISDSTIDKFLGYGIFAFITIILGTITTKCKDNQLEPIYKELNLNKILPLMSFSVISLFFSSQGYRFFRNMSLIVYVSFLNNGMEIKNLKLSGKNNQLINTMYAFFFSIFFFLRQLSWWASNYENVMKKILESNLLLKII